MKSIALSLLLMMSLAACASPRVGVGVGYGVGSARVGVSTSDFGRTVTPGVAVGGGALWGWMSGPSIPLRGDGLPPQQDRAIDLAPSSSITVTGEAAPGVLAGTDE